MSNAADRGLLESLLRHYPRELLRQMIAAAEEAERAAESARSADGQGDHVPKDIEVRVRLDNGRVATWSVPRWRGW